MMSCASNFFLAVEGNNCFTSGGLRTDSFPLSASVYTTVHVVICLQDIINSNV